MPTATKKQDKNGSVQEFLTQNRSVAVEVLQKSLTALNDEEKLKSASAPQLVQVMNAVIERFEALDPPEPQTEDALSRSLKKFASKGVKD